MLGTYEKPMWGVGGVVSAGIVIDTVSVQKPTRAILLCPWKRHFTALSLLGGSWQAVLNSSHISLKFQANSNILASSEASQGNCLLYVYRLRRFLAIQENKYRNKNKIR